MRTHPKGGCHVRPLSEPIPFKMGLQIDRREATLPAGGNATPATYQVNGRQFVVIAAGGGKAQWGSAPSAARYVAFALPK